MDYTERKADVVFGEKDLKITDTDVLVTLTGYTFTSYINGNWITNLPSGLTQKLTRISDTEVKITVSGTPTVEVNEEISVTIPKNNLVEAGKDITAVSNANAKFFIFPRGILPQTQALIPRSQNFAAAISGKTAR